MCISSNASPIVSCAYENWAQYRDVKVLPEEIDPELCTHIAFAYAHITKTGLETTEFNDLDMYSRMQKLRLKNPSLKLLLSVTAPKPEAQPSTTVGTIKMEAFDTTTSVAETDMTISTLNNDDLWLQIPSLGLSWINATLDFITVNGFDGIDLNPTNNHQLDNYWDELMNHDFITFVQDLQTHFNAVDKLVTMTAVNEEMLRPEVSLAELCAALDFVNLHQFNIPQPLNGFNSHVTLNTAKEITEWWLGNGCAAEKVTLGFSTFGNAFVGLAL